MRAVVNPLKRWDASVSVETVTSSTAFQAHCMNRVLLVAEYLEVCWEVGGGGN
jgi:hypothetical protein